MMNRSAKGGARSSPHYGGEGVLIHPPHQGVCGRHGTEDQDVTPGGLVRFPGGTGISDPISLTAKWEVTPVESSDGRIVCAGQRFDPEGSSPSAARMWGGVSKGGGNASPAGERDHGEP